MTNFSFMPNDPAHLPGPLQDLDVARNRNAAPVRCSVWFGCLSPQPFCLNSSSNPMSRRVAE